MARSSWVAVGVAAVLIGLESPAATLQPATCAGTAPCAQAMVVAGLATLRTTHDEMNLLERDGVRLNELDATFKHVTLGIGTSLRILTGDTLDFFSETPVLATIVGASPPIRVDETLTEFVTRTDAVLSRLNLQAGLAEWSVSLRRAGCGVDSMSAPPFVHLRRLASDAFKAAHVHDLVYAGTHYQSGGQSPCTGDTTQNRVVALRTADGATIWQFNGDGQTPVDVIVGIALDRTVQTTVFASVSTTRIRQEDTLFVTTERRASVAQSSVWAIDTLTGTERWSRNAGRMAAPPILSELYGDRIYVVNRSGTFKALSKSDGSEIWSVDMPGLPVVRGVAVNRDGPDQLIVAVDALGRIGAVRDNGTTAEALWKAEIPVGPVPLDLITAATVRAIGTPLVDESGHLFVGATDGAIYQVDIDTGQILASRIVDETRTADITHVVQQSFATAEDPAFLIAASSDGHVAKFCLPFCDGNCHGVPVAGDDSYSAVEDTPLIVAAPGVLTNDADPDGSPMMAVQVSGPAHGELTLNADGGFSYTPVENYNGPDSFSYKATKGTVESNVAAVSISIAAVNDAPVAADGTLTTSQGSPANGTLAAADVDGPSLTFTLVDGASQGTATITDATTGAFSYVPNAGATGTDTFTFRASDGLLDSNLATITVTINPALSVRVLEPNGGESLLAGTTHEIRWAYTGNPGPDVRVDLLVGGVVERVLAAKAPIGAAGQGSFAWTIRPTQTPGQDYQVRVRSTAIATVVDTSDAAFSIAAAPLTVLAPNGGETLSRTVPQTIRWSYPGDPGGRVRIDLLKNGAVLRVIAPNVSTGADGTGSFTWAIPAQVSNAADYQIRITSTQVASATDNSDGPFRIGS